SLDQAFTGGAQWVYAAGWDKTNKDRSKDQELTVRDGAGKLRRNFIIHSYPIAIAGEPIEGGFISPTEKKKFLSFQWLVGPGMLGKKTEIFAPKALFDSGNGLAHKVAILTSDKLKCEYDDAETKITCIAGATGKQELSVRPTPS
ncbi:MAG: hypothetical protein ABIQ95_14855, partial [Bdellovibrionia bacterium]